MARKNVLIQEGRRREHESMVVSSDNKSMRKGRRTAPRTPVCRPCLIWDSETPDDKQRGVVMDLNPYGMRVRMLESLDKNAHVILQMMRDDDFRDPLSQPIRVRVIRCGEESDGFFDHGVKVDNSKPRRARQIPQGRTRRKTQAALSKTSRMHTADRSAAETKSRRTGRSRG